jgi:hypothetical protein
MAKRWRGSRFARRHQAGNDTTEHLRELLPNPYSLFRVPGSAELIDWPKFDVGETYMTPAARWAIWRSGQDVLYFLILHLDGNWGDTRLFGSWWNWQALSRQRGRIISTYYTTIGECLKVITEVEYGVTVVWYADEA